MEFFKCYSQNMNQEKYDIEVFKVIGKKIFLNYKLITENICNLNDE